MSNRDDIQVTRPGCDPRDAVAAAIAELRLGPALGSVMSISAAGQIAGEHCVSRAQAGSVNAALQTAVDRGMTVVAASGYIGAAAYQCDIYSALTGTSPAARSRGFSCWPPIRWSSAPEARA